MFTLFHAIILSGTLFSFSWSIEPIYECSNRFEFRHTITEYVPAFKNCSYVTERFPVCGNNITVALSIDPPYTILDDNKNAAGILPGMLKLAMETCCFGCEDLKFMIIDDVIKKYYTDNASIVMPHEGAYKSSHFIGQDYLPFIEVRGVTFLAKMTKARSNQMTWYLISSILNTWPLFLAAFLMAIIAGCVIWVLDMWFNTDEFPTTFPRGPFEGFWWAFVSMTTVGYGDRAPKSVVARMFAIIWILAGITIFSMYTATLTTALTTEVELSKIDGMFGKKVGVLMQTAAGHSAAIREHAEVSIFNTIDELTNALRDEKIDAIALDDNIASYHMELMKLKIHELTQHHRLPMNGNSFGILSYNKNFTKFIKSFFETNDDNRDTIIARVKDGQSLNIDRANQNNNAGLTLFFSPKSPLFLTIVLLLVGAGVVTIMIGLTCKWFFKKHQDYLDRYINCQQCIGKTKTHKEEVELQMLTNDGSGLQKQFIQELDDFKTKWTILLQNNKS